MDTITFIGFYKFLKKKNKTNYEIISIVKALSSLFVITGKVYYQINIFDLINFFKSSVINDINYNLYYEAVYEFFNNYLGKKMNLKFKVFN